MVEKALVVGATKGSLAFRFAAGYRDGWELKPRNRRDKTKNYACGYAAGQRDREGGYRRDYMWEAPDGKNSRSSSQDSSEETAKATLHT